MIVGLILALCLLSIPVAAAVRYVDCSASPSGLTDPLKLNLSQTAAVDNLLLAQITWNGGSGTTIYKPDESWTLVDRRNATPSQALYYKRVQDTTPTTYTWTFVSDAFEPKEIGIISEFSGIDWTTGPIFGCTNASGSALDLGVPGILAVPAGSMLVACYGTAPPRITTQTPGGMTLMCNYNWPNPPEQSQYPSCFAFNQSWPTTGDTGIRNIHLSSSLFFVAHLVALRPAGDGGCTAPSITTQPVSVTACEGSPVTFSVCATGTAPLSYQWQKNGVDIPLAIARNLVINPVALIEGGDYTVNVSNSCGFAVSSPATLTVNAAPVASFVANPTSGCAPLTVQFNDTSTNNPAMWNWSFGDGTWFNTTDSALRNATKTYSEPGTYLTQLTVSNTCGSNTTVPGTSITVSGLGDALDAPDLTWTTGGAAKWFCEQVVYMNDNDAAESGDIGNSQSSYLRTTMAGPGTLKFNWKVSSEYYDTLRFSIDGVQKAQISGEVGWQQKSYLIGYGTHTVEWKYLKNSATTKGSDCGWVDKVEFIPPDKTPPGIVTDIHNTTYLQNSITWVWTDPTDADFDHVMVYLNGVSKGNVNKGIQTYTASGLTAGRTYTIGIKTVDLSGNINENIQTNSATTAPSTTTASITVVYPNGGEQGYRGRSYPIQWTYTGSPGTTVRIELLKAGLVNRVISSGAPIGGGGTGVYNWLIPWSQTTGSDFKIRITSTTNSAYTDTSNSNFIIR